MALRIPNQGEVAEGFASAELFDQAEPDAQDIDAIVAGIGGRGVLSGCAVTAQAEPDMTVAVASGTVRIAGSEVAVTGGNETIASASEHPRFDLLVAESDGSVTVHQGTPVASIAGGPVFPTVNDDEVMLAAVFVPDGTTAVTDDHITDKRVMVLDPGEGGDPELGGALTGTASNAGIAEGAVDTAELAAGAVTNDKVAADAAIALSKLATDPLARANHTGTQDANTIGSGTVATARLGSGTASSSTFLRGDQTWAAPDGGTARTVRTPEQDGAAGDARIVHDAAISASSTALTSATANFQTGDVGKTVIIEGAGGTGSDGPGCHVTTIASRASTTAVTLTDAAQATVTGARLAVGTDDTDDLNTWLDRAGPATLLRATAGSTYLHTDVLILGDPTGASPVVDGQADLRGACFIAAEESDSAFKVMSYGGDLWGGRFVMWTPSARGSTEDHYKVYMQDCDGFEWHQPAVEGSHAAGILLLGCHNFALYQPTVDGTRADGLHMTGGSRHGRVYHPTITRCGDDGVAIVSYDDTDPDTLCRDIRVYRPYVRGQSPQGRGVVLVGADDCWYYGIDVAGSRQAGVMIATEGAFDSHPVTNSGVVGGTVKACVQDPTYDQGQVHIYSGVSGLTIDNVLLAGLEVVDAAAQELAWAAVRVTNGGGSGGSVSRITVGTPGAPIRVSGSYWPDSLVDYDSGLSAVAENVQLGPRVQNTQVLTESEYAGITPDDDTLYVVVEDE